MSRIYSECCDADAPDRLVAVHATLLRGEPEEEDDDEEDEGGKENDDDDNESDEGYSE